MSFSLMLGHLETNDSPIVYLCKTFACWGTRILSRRTSN